MKKSNVNRLNPQEARPANIKAMHINKTIIIAYGILLSVEELY
ncbi:hypothetical protein LbDm2_1657 [Levilactobacillus brevis]|nr:hypothetical protein LbDm2_1657 [Levilactobacillus brevis]